MARKLQSVVVCAASVALMSALLPNSIFVVGNCKGAIVAIAVKTYKITMSKSDAGSNRVTYVQAQDSSEARRIARDQNPGWQIEAVEEVNQK